MSPTDLDPLKAIEFIFHKSKEYAEAKSEVVYLDKFRKSKHAMLMKDAMVAGHKTSAAQEREAYADLSYIELLKGLRAATEKAEALRWQLVAAQARIDCWRSMEASNRQVDRALS